MNTPLISSLFLALSLLLSSSASATENPAPGAASPAKVRWGWYKVYQPVYIAQEKGYFKESGIELELVGPFTSGPAAVQAATAGKVDAAHTAITGLATAAAEGFKLKAVADSQSETKKAPLMRWYVKKESPIREAKDLKGKTIAVNSFSGSFYFTILKYLEKAGLKKEDVKFVNMPHPNQPQALLTGQVDVAGVIDPFSAQLQESNETRTLVTGYDILGENQFSVIFFTEEFIKKNPETVKKFVRAYQKAVGFIEKNPDLASQIIAKQIEIDPKYNTLHRYTRNAQVKLQDVEFWIRSLEDSGILKQKGAVKASDISDLSFIR